MLFLIKFSGEDMKLTTNFIVYLNADNEVQCAKCRISWRFVKRAIAQDEYALEYNYKVTFKSFVSFMFTVFYVLLSIALNSVQNALGFNFINLLYKHIANGFKGVYNWMYGESDRHF